MLNIYFEELLEEEKSKFTFWFPALYSLLQKTTHTSGN